jgi:hypothetical protein
MSIVTLKRKTQAKYNNSSVSQPQFSLNGTHRSQGYVGQDMRGRYLSRTLMKGDTPKGSGGCGGYYIQGPIVNSDSVFSVEDANVVKSSSVNTLGLHMTKYQWARRPAPFSSSKPDDNHSIHTYHTYLAQKKAKEPDCHETSASPAKTSIGCDGFNSIQRPTSGIDKTPLCKTTGKPGNVTGAMSADYVLERRVKSCPLLDDVAPQARVCKMPLIGKSGNNKN